MTGAHCPTEGPKSESIKPRTVHGAPIALLAAAAVGTYSTETIQLTPNTALPGPGHRPRTAAPRRTQRQPRE
ncbi:hypothetical protein ABT115_26210 [Streptomyces sp. NPDC001832]|uniref:hypothetical protein n=1 Tax=Streptomyces sp. NPDC001832 TaxID=3154527 RepID=UPI00331937B6